MTPEEKANELINRYYNYISEWTSTNRISEPPSARYEGEKMKINIAKQCALIVCDEILNGSKVIGTKAVSRRKFWHDVRSAIDAL